MPRRSKAETRRSRRGRVVFTCLQRTPLGAADANRLDQVKDRQLARAMATANALTRALTKQILQQRGLWA